MKIPTPSLSKRAKILAATATALLASTYASVKMIRSNEFGLQQTMGVVTSGVKQPGVYFQVPLVQITHSYRANTQTISFGAGSNRFFPWKNDTSDRNILIADVALHYKVIPDAEKLSFWRWSMRDWFAGSNGYWLLTSMANDSANAALGRRTTAAALSQSADFARDFYQDLALRFDRNNIPVQIQSIEIKDIRTTIFPIRNIQYQVVGPSVISPPGPKPQ